MACSTIGIDTNTNICVTTYISISIDVTISVSVITNTEIIASVSMNIISFRISTSIYYLPSSILIPTIILVTSIHVLIIFIIDSIVLFHLRLFLISILDLTLSQVLCIPTSFFWFKLAFLCLPFLLFLFLLSFHYLNTFVLLFCLPTLWFLHFFLTGSTYHIFFSPINLIMLFTRNPSFFV